MNPTAIYSKSGKGVQEASGKTSHLARADRAVLSAIDGRLTVKEVAERVGRPFDAKFEQLVQKLDSEGFIRQVSSGSAAMAAPPARPASGPARPGGKPAGPGEDLDFTVIMAAPVLKPAPPPAAPAGAIGGEAAAKAQAAAFAKAREEAEIKAQKERDRLKAEAEAKFRAEQETKLRSEAEVRAKEEAAARIKAEAEAKIRAAREAAVRAAAEAKAQAEAERKAREEAERKAREEAERVRREAEELRQRLEAERKAREEAERQAREAAERARREAEEKARREAEEKARREAEELRQRLEAERKAREEAERKAREEAERARKEAEEKARREAEELRQRLEAEHQAREAAERKAREEAERARKEAEEQARQEAEQARREAEELRGRLEAERREREQEDARRAQEREREEAERKERQAREADEARAKAAAARPRTGDKFADSLMDDLDSFTQRDEDERKEKEEAQLRAKQEAERQAREEKERAERERKERAEREAEERKRKEEESRKAREREEEERRERAEKERAEREAEERRRRREARAKTESASEDEDDIVVSEDDLDMDDVKQDQAVLTEDARRAAKEREKREKEARREAKREAARRAKEDKRKEKAQERPAVAPAYQPIRRRRSWGKPIAITLFLVLAAGIGALHVMPIGTAEYEQAASQALGRPVTIGAARLSLYSGVQLNLSNVSVGEVKVPAVRAFPAIGSLFGPQKSFSRLELEGATLPQQALGALFDARLRGENFAVERIHAKGLKLTGPVKLPALDAELAFGSDGSITSTTVRGSDGLQGKIVPNGKGLDFDVVANSFAVPIFPDVWLSGFAMKGSATPEGMRIREWGGGSLDGGISGTANVRWGSNWVIDGVVTVRGINAAVFAPALLSEGNAEGTAKFFLNDPDPMNFLSRGRLEGNFSVHKGVLGSFDLSRAIQTGGRQAGGRTPFTGMNGHGVFDRGAVALRNVSFGAGAMNAGASADIGADGKLSGRIVADVSTSSQTLRATLNLGGTVRDPQVKN